MQCVLDDSTKGLASSLAVVSRLLLFPAVLLSPVVAAQTGVSDDRVNLPDGPGSLDGVGDNTSVNANMGHMQTSVPIDVPQGFSGLTPDFTLGYSSGNGSGVVGIGWSMAIPSIERMTAKGLPLYVENDLFVANGSEELVRISSGEPAIYRARYEGGFVRYAWHDRGAGDAGYWTAEFPTGEIATFGAAFDGTPDETARLRSADGVFRYLATEVRDRYGHTIDYAYRFYGAVPLLDLVSYAHDNDGVPRYTVAFDYEDRPDAISDARGGFNERLAHRLSTIRISSRETVIRRYAIDYEDEDTAGALSRIARVARTGRDGGEYGVVYTFEYSRSLASVCDGVDCEEPLLVSAGNIGASFATGRVNLIDLNGDGLPDAIESQPTGPHRIYLGQMSPDGTHTFAAPFDSAVGDAGTFELASPYTQVLDVDGDGFTDLINSLAGRVLYNRGGGDWAENASLLGNAELPDFSEDFALDEDGQLEHIRFVDVDLDRRIDVIRSDEVGTTLFRNLGELGFVADSSVQELEAGFADDSTDLADMNGDGLLDPIQIREGLVRYRLHLGQGQWTNWTSISGAPILFEDIPNTALEDLNGDGIDDIVAVVGGEVKYALNRNSLFFTEQQSVTSTRGQPLPVDDGTIVVLYADMNANGSTDVVYIDDAGDVTYLDLFPVRPNLLSRVENGIGYTVDATYTTVIQERARTQGEGWDDPLPMPSIVVKTLDVYTAAAAAELTVHEIVTYDYESGFYDGVEKQFRGFRRTTTTEEQETGVITNALEFDVGAGDNRGHFAGLTLRDTLLENDVALQTTTSTYADCPLADVPDSGSLRTPLLYACLVEEEMVLQEKRPAAEWVTKRQTFTEDGFGNRSLEENHGVVAIGGAGCGPCTRPEGTTGAPCGEQCLGDEEILETTYIQPPTNGDVWLLRLPAVARERATEAGRQKEEHYFYDGEAFAGLPEGRAVAGNLSRQTSLVAEGEPPTTRIRSRFDLHGNLVEGIAATGPASGSHRVRTLFDETGLFPTRIERDVGTGDDRVTLARDYTYDEEFGAIESATAWYRVGEDPSATRTRWSYDEHGRVESVTRPTEGGLADATTEEYVYELGSPYSRIIERARSDVSGAFDLEMITCLDGLGRTVQTRKKVGPDAYQVGSFTTYDRQGNPVRVYRPTLSADDSCALPPDDALFTAISYDGAGREVGATLSDGDRDGGASERRTVYFPLETHFYNEDDNDPQSPGANTPNIARYDGLERVVASVRTRESGDDEVNTIFYDDLGRIAGVVDAAGNTKRQAYDLLDRVIEVEDPDANRTTFAYNADDQIVRIEDARGVVTRFAYDELSRRIEEWNDADRAGTLVRWVYDLDPGCADCPNQAGKLVATEYETPFGVVRESFEFDARGNLIALVQDAQGAELRVEYAFDNADRLVSTTYPDGRTIANTLDVGSRVTAVTDVINAMEYDAEGRPSAVTLGDNVRLELGYSPRGSIAAMKALAGGVERIDVAFERDRLERVQAIDDNVRTGRDALSAELQYDALGCLSEVTYDDETLTFRADNLSRLLEKQSSLGAESRAHVGTLAYDAVAPRRVLSAGDVEWTYDEAGYAVRRGDDAFTFDRNGRVTQISRDGTPVLDVTRTAAGDRLLTKEGPSERRHLGDGFEIRDGIARINVSIAGTRVAMLESDALATTLFEDRVTDGVINGADAFAARGESAQRTLLRSAARRALLDVQGEKTLLVPDGQGSTIAVLSADGELRERLAYYPYGGIRVTTATETEFANYTGKEHDVSGYLDFGARVLSPNEGRWLSPDPKFHVLDGSIVESPAEAFSAYAFVANDPVNFVDRAGFKSSSDHAFNSGGPSGQVAPKRMPSFGSVSTFTGTGSQSASYSISGGSEVAVTSASLNILGPHEATHVAQQSQSVSAPSSTSGVTAPSTPPPSGRPTSTSLTTQGTQSDPRSRQPTLASNPSVSASSSDTGPPPTQGISTGDRARSPKAKSRSQAKGPKASKKKLKKGIKRKRKKISRKSKKTKRKNRSQKVRKAGQSAKKASK